MPLDWEVPDALLTMAGQPTQSYQVSEPPCGTLSPKPGRRPFAPRTWPSLFSRAQEASKKCPEAPSSPVSLEGLGVSTGASQHAQLRDIPAPLHHPSLKSPPSLQPLSSGLQAERTGPARQHFLGSPSAVRPRHPTLQPGSRRRVRSEAVGVRRRCLLPPRFSVRPSVAHLLPPQAFSGMSCSWN